MSNSVSPAQRLPIEVLHLIIKYVVNEKKGPFGGIGNDKRMLKALPSVCLNWRQAAIECLWNKANININAKSTGVYLARPPWVKENVLSQNTANVVRELCVSVSLSGIVRGTAHKCLVKYLGDTKCFPLAHKLVVTVNYVRSELFKDVVVDNIVDFADYLKSLAPAAKTTEVVCATKSAGRGYFDDGSADLDEDSFGLFAKSICGDSKRVRLDLGDIRLFQSSIIDCIPQLSRLNLFCLSTQIVGMGLVHKSAKTLQHLQIEIHNPSLLFYDVNDNEVVYPAMQNLSINYSLRNVRGVRPVSTEYIPFPILTSLSMDLQYIFDNDVLFRGNSTTLEYLHITIDNHFLEMCNESRVFENKHKALRHVILRRDSGDDELHLVSQDDVNKLLNNLMSNAKRFVVSSVIWLHKVIVAVQHGQGFQNIRILETTFKEMSLSYVLCILKALPAITRLRSGINGVGHTLVQFENDDLPDHIVSTYCNVGSKLEVWEMTSFDSRYETDITNYILLLALVCSNLRRVELMPKSVPDCRNKITETLGSDPYSKYALQLSHVCDIIYE